MTQFNILIKKLEEANVPHAIYQLFDGQQVCILDGNGAILCDVIFHKYCYGYSEGLLEYMGPCAEDDEVIGFLNAEQAFAYCLQDYQNNKPQQEQFKIFLLSA